MVNLLHNGKAVNCNRMDSISTTMSKLSNFYGSTTDRGVVAYIYASQTRVQYCVRSDKLGSASEYITSPAIGLLIVPGYL